MFKENFLIHIDAGDAATKMLIPTSTAEERQRDVLSNTEVSGQYSADRVKAASEETQQPIMNTVRSIRNMLGAALWYLPIAGAKKVTGFATDLTTNAIALPANLGRWVMDLVSFVPRGALTVTDTVAEQTFGRISKVMKQINTKVHNSLGTEPTFTRPEAAAT